MALSDMIFLDKLNLLMEMASFRAGGSSVVGDGCQLTGNGMSGMQAGLALVQCGRDLQKAMELLQQLINSNSDRIMELAERIEKADTEG